MMLRRRRRGRGMDMMRRRRRMRRGGRGIGLSRRCRRIVVGIVVVIIGIVGNILRSGIVKWEDWFVCSFFLFIFPSQKVSLELRG